MCQKASKPLHSEATEVSSRSGLIYFDSCANSPFNYLLLRLEKHLEGTAISGGSGGVGAGGCRVFSARKNQPTNRDCWRCCCRLRPHPPTHVSVCAGFVSAGCRRGIFFFLLLLLFLKVAKQVSRVSLEFETNSACATVEAPRVSLGGENRVLSSAPLNKRATSVWQ